MSKKDLIKGLKDFLKLQSSQETDMDESLVAEKVAESTNPAIADARRKGVCFVAVSDNKIYKVAPNQTRTEIGTLPCGNVKIKVRTLTLK